MQRMKTDIALLTSHRYLASQAREGDWYLDNILHDDRLLQLALQQLGLSSQRVDWADPSEDWSRFRCAVFRTTWDYFDRFAEFNAWFDRVQSQTQLFNAPPIIRWNMDKHYLADLDAKGVSIVRSHFIERGTTLELRALLDETGWDQAVIKPCVSGGARHTYRVDRASARQLQPIIQALLATKAFLLQPFEPAIMAQGEDSLMMIGGRYSHAVRKVAKPGDFRVQDDHGGTVHAYEPTAAQIALAERAMAACDTMPIYGRVDMVRVGAVDAAGGHDAVMELELIEPELWLRLHPPAATLFAEAIAASL